MIFGYCRSSRPSKSLRYRPASTDSPLGVSSQQSAILERFPGAQVFTDAARTGRNANRPALREMLAGLRRGDVVVVVRLDRLARDFRLMMALELQIETTSGARLVSLAGEVRRGGDQRSDNTKPDNVRIDSGGNGSDFLLRRLAKTAPDILDRYEAGEFKSVRAASIAAGHIKVATVLERLLKLWEKATEAERAEFRQHTV